MQNTTYKVLVIEDNQADISIIKRYLVGGSALEITYEVDTVEKLKDAIGKLRDERYHLIITDLTLPDSKGLKTFQDLHWVAPHIPVVIYSGLQDESEAIRAIGRGAQDYVIKGEVDEGHFNRILRYAIERQKLDDMKDDFLNNISHELRTPLQVVSEVVKQMSSELYGAVSDEQKNHLGVALRNIDRLGILIRDFIQLSQIESREVNLSYEEVEVGELLQLTAETFRQKAESKGLQLKITTPQPILCSCDQGKIRLVLEHLMENAVKFTDSGAVEVRVLEDGDRCCFEIIDSGRGVSDQEVGKIFDKFHQVDRQIGSGSMGTGMGLAICRGLIELHGGEIFIDTGLEVGTKISFWLPKKNN